MSAYNKVNGEFCGHNSHLLRDILKKEWNFPGFVMSDFMLGIRNGRKALLGGLDIEMPFKFHMRVSKMRKLVKSGQVPESLVDDGVRRILREKLRFNRTSDPQMYTKEKIACIEHRQLALEVAQKSLVLLKNEAHVLPLDKTQVKKLALIGRLVKEPNIGDHGSSKVHPSKIITVLEGCQTLVGDQIEIIADTGKNLDQAKRFAQDADAVVIVIGYTHKDEGEYLNPAVGGDRISIRLHAPDVKLIQELSKVNKRCVVVLEGGSAIITDEWNAQIPAILMAWYPGMEGGTAIAQTLFGLNNPSGKLPCIFPKSEEQLPFFDRDAKEITYEYYHGYKLLDKNKSEPRYAFGYGLSYTTFSLKQIEIDKAAYTENDTILIRAEIENTGQHTGAEVVQTYVGYEKSALDRPVKDLRGFKRVHLKPGEKKRIEIPILIKDLAYYDPQEKCWRIEKMDYSLYVGTSSRMEDLKQFRFKIQ
jgi:beta-glucosidase